MTFNKKRLFLTLGNLILILAIIFSIIYITNIDTVTLEDNTSISIPSGASTKKIATILKENDLIKSKFAYINYVKKNNYATKLCSGKFYFSKGELTFESITNKLIKGGFDSSNTINVTIPEGYTVLQIAELLESHNLVNKDKFLEYAANMEIPYSYIEKTGTYQQLEGFLFPNTYNFSLNWTEKEIINIMLKEFDNVWTDEHQKRADDLGYSVKEIITIASLIEREAKIPSERPTISSVIHNRLEVDMLLQIDATIQYILGKQKERLYYKDLEVKSPYNTYLNKGLPPTPIAVPGLSCIEAALYPEDTPYFYYRTKKANDGSHHFAETLSEHIANGNR